MTLKEFIEKLNISKHLGMNKETKEKLEKSIFAYAKNNAKINCYGCDDDEIEDLILDYKSTIKEYGDKKIATPKVVHTEKPTKKTQKPRDSKIELLSLFDDEEEANDVSLFTNEESDEVSLF